MTAFFDLFVRASAGPDSWTDPTWADRQLPDLVAASPFRPWKPDDPIPQHGVRVLIGVATWSGYDMRLLDVIAETIARDPGKAPTVEVFNTAACKQHSDFREYIPKLGDVLQVPVVGVWRDGRLEKWGEGYAARDLAARMFGSSSDEVVAYVTNWRNARATSR